jgi:5-methylcytosine-specific restriction endonuclease McrA
MNICENCNIEHNGEYGSGRFCSVKCARGFSTKEKRKEINEKVSDTLIKRHHGYLTKQQYVQRKIAEKHASYERLKETTSILDMSKRTTMKILRRMKLPCFTCGWFHEGVVGDVHHIIPRKNGGSDENSNLTYICPNCHRLVHSDVIKPSELITIEDYLDDSWKKYYYTK